MSIDEYEHVNTGTCNYFHLTTRCTAHFSNSFFHLNVRSLASKLFELEALIGILNFPKVFLLSETWLSVNSVLLNIDNYSFISSPRCNGRGGGVGMYIHNSLHYLIKSKSCNVISNNGIDFVMCEFSQLRITLACMYCPPGTKHLDIINTITLLKEASNAKTSFIVGGDFNVNLFDSQSDSILEFLNSLFSLGLYPTVSLPTRVTDTSSTLIDNFFCDISLLPAQSNVIKSDISDHYTIALKPKASLVETPSFTRDFSLNNKLNFTNKILASDWNPLYLISDTNLAFNYFLKKFKRIYNKSFPFYQIVSKPCNKPWLTPSIIKSIRHKNALFLKSKANALYRGEYTQYRNLLNSIIRKAKYDYHRRKLDNYRKQSAKLWAHLNSLFSNKSKSQIPLSANDFNTFFTSIFRQAPQLQANHNYKMPDEAFVTNSLFLSPVTNNEIINIITSLSNSPATGSDGLVASIIKSNSALIAPQLTYIFNLSLTQGIFPSLLKNAIVIPVYKSGSLTDPNNYRPISLLTFFSKVLEKLFLNRIVPFLNRNNVLHDKQFGFSKGKSTSDALTCLLSSLISKYNTNKTFILTLLDLKKAFDFVNHDLLLYKIKHYGIRGIPHKWISDYLTNRTQSCKVNGSLSSPMPIFAGVPQGSILGPLLFNLFVNDVFDLESSNVEIFLYADDTAILFTENNNFNLQLLIDDFLS
jgi:hypothetical protein